MEESYSCDDDAWCNDTYCKFVAMNVECSPMCKGGAKCGNQRIQRGNTFEFVQLFDAGDKGMGLKVTKCFKAHEFIIQYIGTVSDSSVGVVNTYKVHLKEKGLVVDASTKGNFARFINHSCDPNCKMEVWEVSAFVIENDALFTASLLTNGAFLSVKYQKVDGRPCAALFACQTIMPGEELTFNYFGSSTSYTFPNGCHCGSKQCKEPSGRRITIGGGIPNPRNVTCYFAASLQLLVQGLFEEVDSLFNQPNEQHTDLIPDPKHIHPKLVKSMKKMVQCL